MAPSRLIACAVAAFAIVFGSPGLAIAETRSSPTPAHATNERVHRVVIQITQNEPAIMNMALNNAENMLRHYEEKGEKIEIEFVAYGAGLNMFRSDTSPVKDRLVGLGGDKRITFSGCGNTLSNQSRMENKEIALVPEARIVSTGIARIVELEEQGWTYVRP
jgi:intracellular sulfur oxidation DsrE/DsrF family protein